MMINVLVFNFYWNLQIWHDAVRAVNTEHDQGTIPNEQMFAQMIDVLVTGDGLSGPEIGDLTGRFAMVFRWASHWNRWFTELKKTWWFSMAMGYFCWDISWLFMG
jgi:hypothetical protein